eukprot:g1855.t1
MCCVKTPGSVTTKLKTPTESSTFKTTVSKREDLKTIMVIGAGPIVIGQACEFDYSGTQACKALRSEGFRVVLLNSNPATVMTDPGTADRTYIGPMTPSLVEEILDKERPDALLPTMGGQTGLNLAKELAEQGILDKYGVELIGAKLPSIDRAEDRELFKQAMKRIGLKTPLSRTATTLDEAIEFHKEIGSFPLIIRPAFTLGGTGGGIAYNMEEFVNIVKRGLEASITNQVLIEMSLLGWKEFELEVMRDLGDNVVIICSIENVDPMGIHTGDSITVAPSQTLTDKEYQRLRDAAIHIIREMGVECGGSNVQMAINPVDGEMMIIEMNPRVSRSSALASKATGFPIAKMAAKLAIGYTLDQIPNDITEKTPASFEPSIDYVVTKIPRFAFEKFPGSVPELTTQMKSVGEAMAIGRTFMESFQKALRSLETGLDGWSLPTKYKKLSPTDLSRALRVPNPERMLCIKQAFEDGMSSKEIFELTAIDPWFLSQLEELHQTETWLRDQKLESLSKEDFLEVKRRGFSDSQISRVLNSTPELVRAARKSLGVIPSMKRVDTCAAEFEAKTPYMYSSYEDECECDATSNPKVLILGGGPNRIGQGIEFDYCCCHASFALRDAGFETIMLNSNPETVSTDYDTSSRLYFEPLTMEDVLNVIEKERPDGIIVQFGGQTPLKLATGLQRALECDPIPAASGKGMVRIWGTSPDSIDEAEDRDRWMLLLSRLGITQPPGSVARSENEALASARSLGYPVMVRPSYVLGGRAMEIVNNDQQLKKYIRTAVEVDPERPVLVDKYIDEGTELDVDALCDQEGNVAICGIMEHIEQAGIHSGDSACSLPPLSLNKDCLKTIEEWTASIAKALKVVGLINIQYVVQNNQPYIIEANPRASRTVPFVAKAIGHQIAKYASLLMAGHLLKDVGFTSWSDNNHVAVKEVTLPFDKFPGTDTLLGPEMRSTGEVMGIDDDFAHAFAKAQIAAGQSLPLSGTVFVSMNDSSKEAFVPVAKELLSLGYDIVSTGGTANYLSKKGISCTKILKIHEGRPNISDALKDREIGLVMITSNQEDENDRQDGRDLRRLAVSLKIPMVTTVAGAKATIEALEALKTSGLKQIALQDYFGNDKSSHVITNLKQVVDTVSKDTDVICLTRSQTEDIVKSIRPVLEDGLKGDEKTKPSIWNVLKRLSKLCREEFGSSVRKVRTAARQDGLDSQKRADMWIEQALLDGLMETLIEKIQDESELKNLYSPESAILDPNKRSEILEVIDKLKRVFQPNTHSVDDTNSPSNGEKQKDSDDQGKEPSSSFGRLWNWSRKTPISESANPPTSTNFTLEERTAAARLLLKELQDTSRRVIRQYSANKLPLSIKSYPLSKLCSLYEEAFSFGMRPCPLFRPSGPIKYLSELQGILTKGMASSIALLYGLETIMEVKGLNAAEFRQLPQDDNEQFRRWLHSCLLDGTFARKLETIIENPDFMQGWYYTKALITDEDLSQQLLIACHLIENIEILPESPRHEQQESSIWQGEYFNEDINEKEEEEEDNSKTMSCEDANTLVTTTHEEPKTVTTVAHKEENAVTTLSHEEDHTLVTTTHEEPKTVTTVAHKEENAVTTWSHEEDNTLADISHEEEVLMPISHEELEEIVADDSEGQLTPLSSPQHYNLQEQMPHHIHENQDLPINSPFAAEGMNYPSPDSSTSTEDAVEEVITENTSPEYHNAKLRAGDQSRTTISGVISFTTEDEEEWSGVWKDIDVLRYEIKGNGRNDQYAVYVIEAMTSDGTQWQTARRFSELEALRKILSKKNVNLPHSWSNLSGAKGVHGKAKFGSDVLEARLVLFRQCLWDFKVTYPEALVWQPVSDFLGAPLSILKSTRLRQRHSLAYDAVLQDKFADRVLKIRQGMHLIVDLPTPIPDEVLFEIQHGSCPGCQGYLPSISHNKPMFKGSPSPRKCEYTELLYCHSCHHLDSALLPSKILNEWDFRKSLVSVGAKKYILSIFPHPVLCINSVNPGLLASVPVLGHLQYIRLDIIQKLDALRRKGREGKRIAEVFERKAGDNVYLIQNADYWSLKDLGDISRGFLAALPRWLEMIHSRITKLVALKEEELALGAIL